MSPQGSNEWQADEMPPPVAMVMAPRPDYTPEQLTPIATMAEMVEALRQAEAACTKAKLDRDHALKMWNEAVETLSAARGSAKSDIDRLKNRLSINGETLGLRDNEIQSLTRDLEAQFASTNEWYHRFKEQQLRRKALTRELGLLYMAHNGLWRFVWRSIRGRAITLTTTQPTTKEKTNGNSSKD